jgi:hypothetical protein
MTKVTRFVTVRGIHSLVWVTTQAHDNPLKLSRDRPGFVVELAGEILNLPIPPHDEVLPYSESCTDKSVHDLNADNVVVCRAGDDNQLGIILEIQREKDKRKRFTWPAYQVNCRHRIQAPVVLMVVCSNPTVAAWAAEPIETGQPGSDFRMQVQQETYPYQSKLLAEREARGEARGKVEGVAEMLLDILDMRGVRITENERRRVENCGDLAQLRAWGKLAVTARTAADIFG